MAADARRRQPDRYLASLPGASLLISPSAFSEARIDHRILTKAKQPARRSLVTRNVIWALALLWAVAAHITNACRSHRLHCYTTGPIVMLGFRPAVSHPEKDAGGVPAGRRAGLLRLRKQLLFCASLRVALAFRGESGASSDSVASAPMRIMAARYAR
jgi:hypothetical protein